MYYYNTPQMPYSLEIEIKKIFKDEGNLALYQGG